MLVEQGGGVVDPVVGEPGEVARGVLDEQTQTGCRALWKPSIARVRERGGKEREREGSVLQI